MKFTSKVIPLIVSLFLSSLSHVSAESGATIKFKVPVQVSALYLVPTNQPPADAMKTLQSAINSLPASTSKTAAVTCLKEKRFAVKVLDDSALADIPLELFEELGASKVQVDALSNSKHFIEIRVTGRPGWPMPQEYAGRAASCAFASSLHTTVIDENFPNVFEPDKLMKMLPAPGEPNKFSDWLTVSATPYKRGVYADTRGLVRVGLPELQANQIPQTATHFPQILKALAWKLTKMYSGYQKNHDKPLTTWEIPSDIELNKKDLDEAKVGSLASGGAMKIHLRFVPGNGKESQYLTITRPDGDIYRLPDYMSTIDKALYGSPAPKH